MNSSVRVKNEVNQPNVSCLSVLALQVIYHPNTRMKLLRVARTFFSKTVGKPQTLDRNLTFWESNVLGWAHTYVAEYKGYMTRPDKTTS